jgi:uncharacterized protein YuzE
MTLAFRYDKEADAAYIQLDPIAAGGVARTEVANVELDSAAINLDFDEDGRLVGIEILGARRILPAELLESHIEE